MSGYNAPSQPFTAWDIRQCVCGEVTISSSIPTGSMVVLPMHTGTLKVGILLDAIELAGISPEEFEELL